MDNRSLHPKLNDFFQQFNSIHHFDKREIILRADEDPPGIFFLKKGYVKLYAISESGREITFNIFKPGSYFSMMWAIGNSPNSYFFEAMTAVEAWRAPKDKLIEYLQKEPELLLELTRNAFIGMNGLLSNIRHLLFGNAEVKIASVLLLSTRRFGNKINGNIEIQLPLTHQDIAGLAGLTRETTSLEMEKLKKAGIINYRKKLIQIMKIQHLEDLLSDPNAELLPEII